MTGTNWLFISLAIAGTTAVLMGVFLLVAARQTAGLLIRIPRKPGRGK